MSRKHRRTVPDIAIAMPIVPMLDLSFQILFFFMITFNPSRAEGKMSLNLPATGQAKAKTPEAVDLNPTESSQDLEVPADFVVVVRSYEESFSLQIKTAEKPDEVGTIRDMNRMNAKERQTEIDKLLEKLRDQLTTRLKEKKEKEGDKATDNVKIEANGKTKYSVLVGVMDACIKAGYVQVGFAPPPDLNQQ
jgi:biopolymer transport protein ExbD